MKQNVTKTSYMFSGLDLIRRLPVFVSNTITISPPYTLASGYSEVHGYDSSKI